MCLAPSISAAVACRACADLQICPSGIFGLLLPLVGVLGSATNRFDSLCNTALLALLLSPRLVLGSGATSVGLAARL